MRIFDGTVQDGRTNSDTHRRQKGPPLQERKSDAQTRTVVSGYVFIVKLLIPRINLTAHIFDHTCSRGDEARDIDTHRRRKGPPPQERKSDAQMRTVVSGYVFIVKLLFPLINLTEYL